MVTMYWKIHLQHLTRKKSSLNRMVHEVIPTAGPHPVWRYSRGEKHKVESATIRAKMLTGRHILQAALSRYNQNQVDPTYKVCKIEPEGMPHFLLRCPAFKDKRTQPLADFWSLVAESGLPMPTSDEARTRSILNWGPHLEEKFQPQPSMASRLNQLASHLCRKPHEARDVKLNDTIMSQLK